MNPNEDAVAMSLPSQPKNVPSSPKTVKTTVTKVENRDWETSLTVKCRFCGGANCRRCSRQCALAKTNSPVKGLHADWVTPSILGMMRPATELIAEFGIYQEFKRLNIQAIFNVTMPGEHPHCGYPLKASGFPYDPEATMAEGIQFYNFGWEDMTVPTLPYMLNIVKVMSSVLEPCNAKIAVHCHAGYGRTGLAIACTLMYMHRLTATEVVTIIRRNRPGSIQTAKQEAFVRLFHEYLHKGDEIFAVTGVHEKFTLRDAVDRQGRRVHGNEATAKLHVPMLIDELCDILSEKTSQNAKTVAIAIVMHASHTATTMSSNATLAILGVPDGIEELKKQIEPVSASILEHQKMLLNRSQLDLKSLNLSLGIAVGLFLDWFDHLSSPVLEVAILDTIQAADENEIVIQNFNKHSSPVMKTMQVVKDFVQPLVVAAPEFGTAVINRLLASLMQLDLYQLSNAKLVHYNKIMSIIVKHWQAPRMELVNKKIIQRLNNNPGDTSPEKCNTESRKLFRPSSLPALPIQKKPPLSPSAGSRHKLREIIMPL